MIEKPIFCRPVPLGSIATGNERAEAPAAHLGLYGSPGLVWRTNGSSNAWARGQMPALTAINMASVVAANAQAGTTIRLRLGTSQAQVDGGSAPYDSGVVTFISPAETVEGGRYHSYQRFTSVDATWWRLDISGHTGDFEAMGLILGTAAQTTRFYDRGWELSPIDLGDFDLSRFGVAMETDGIVMRAVSFKLSWVSEAEFKASFENIMRATKREPIWLLFNPEAISGRQSQFYFGRFGQAPFAQNSRKPGTFAMEFAMQSMI